MRSMRDGQGHYLAKSQSTSMARQASATRLATGWVLKRYITNGIWHVALDIRSNA